MSNRTFVLILVVVAIVVLAAVMMHTPGGQSLMRTVHGSR